MSASPTSSNQKAHQYESAYATHAHLHQFLVKSEGDNYIAGQKAAKFYLITSFLYILLIFALFGYAIVRRLDDAVAVSSSSSVVDSMTTTTLSSATLANIGLAVSALLFGILMIIKVTRPIPYEYAFFVAALWIVFGAFSRNECVCCQVIVSDGQGHFHPRGTSTGLLDSINHRLTQMGVCDHLTLITALHSIGIILMISLLYAAIFRDYDYFAVEERVRRQMRFGYGTNQIDAERLIIDSSAGGGVSTGVPWFKALLILVIIILALIPFSCNNSTELPLQNYFIRIILFLAIFLLRLINTYTLRYNLAKFARGFNVFYSVSPTRADAVDERILEPVAEPNDGLDIPPPGPYTSDLTTRLATKTKINLIAQDTARSTTISVIIDGIISSMVLLLCGWFLTVAAAQVVYEMVVLYLAVIYHRNTQIQLREAYAQKEVLASAATLRSSASSSSSSIINNNNNNSTGRPNTFHSARTAKSSMSNNNNNKKSK